MPRSSGTARASARHSRSPTISWTSKAFRARYGIEETAHAAFALIPEMVNFRDPSSINNLIATVSEVATRVGLPLRWIIVDTLSRALAGGNENDSEDMGALVRGADQV